MAQSLPRSDAGRTRDPGHGYDPYVSTRLRAPTQPLVALPDSLSILTGPAFDTAPVPGASGAGGADGDATDLTSGHAGEPLGERIVVSGRVVDSLGRPVAGALVEIWQANAAGRYTHPEDRHDAPLDPNFTGTGRLLTGPDGGYTLTTVKPGAYPWRNHANAWRPAHIHFSVSGRSFEQRLITQMYFPGDPLLAYDPILAAVRDVRARQRLVSSFDLGLTRAEWALGYRFDIVLGGRDQTPLDPPEQP